jgi:ribosomal protein S6
MSEKHSEETISRVYEAGYHVIPSVQEGDVEQIVAAIRSEIEKQGGSLIAEGSPSLMKLSYDMEQRVGEKLVAHDRGYFGWIKFEAGTHAAKALTDALNAHKQIFRSIVFKTVREDTRAKYKAPQLREVKRSDTLKAAPRKVETSDDAAPVSEADLEKALETLTAE